MNEQQLLDQAFLVTAQERAALREGRVPASVLRRLRTVSRSPFARGAPLAIPLAMLAGIALGGLSHAPRESLDRTTLLSALAVFALLVVLCVRLLDWLHERKVHATRPMLRIVEGSVQTIRTWQYGYGDSYHLWTALEFAHQPQSPICLFDKLGNHTIAGWARVFLATVPTRKRGLAPYYEEAIAVEASEDTIFVEREPRNPPPADPLRVNVAAD